MIKKAVPPGAALQQSVKGSETVIHLYSENEWLYPDTVIGENCQERALHAPLGGSVCCQVLTDDTLEQSSVMDMTVSAASPVIVTPYQLLPVTVDHNSDRKLMCAESYAEVSDFVTREAPFRLFEATRRIDNGRLAAGRIALWMRFDVPQDCPTGQRELAFSVKVGDIAFSFRITLTVHNCTVPALSSARFGMINWLDINMMDRFHALTKGSPQRERTLEAYLRDQLDMRNTDLKIPSGVPVYDETGRIVDFDFSEAEWVGNKALKMGFRHILGGFVARWKKWSEDENYLLWDREIAISSLEGYRQLSLYFKAARECRDRNGWGERYQQCLVDEPQFPNSGNYRILCGMARKFLPGIVIHDPVESSLLYGGTDIWCVKQAVYEDHIDDFRAVQALGEPIWLYTCGFPAGYMMNRIMDLPLAATRLPFWMCILYRCVGFLHWGYNCWTDRPFDLTCYPPPHKNGAMYPAGNAHLVYPGEYAPIDSVRAHHQRMGAEDAELLMQLVDRDPEQADSLIRTVARTFLDYENDPAKLDAGKLALLNALEA